MTARRIRPFPRLTRVRVPQPPDELPFPLGEAGCELFSRARHALWQGVQALGLAPGDHVLVPAYHHGAEIEALLRAGLECRYYDATPTLEPDQGELEALVDPRVRALLLIHYLGFPQDAARWRSWCDERGLALIEDCAQAWLSARDGHPVGWFGDLSVFSLHKTISVPDGAAMLVRRPAMPILESRRALGVVPLALRSAQTRDGTRRDRVGDPAAEVALGDPRTPPTHATAFLLPRVVDERARSRRRANYEVLLRALPDLVPPPFENPPAGASPFAFPIASDERARLLERLDRAGVEALDLFGRPHPSLDAAAFPAAAARRAREIALPVHQDLGPEEVERMAAAVRGRKPSEPPLRIEPLATLDEIPDEWSALAEASRNIFATPEWATTWWRHFGRGSRLLAAAVRAPGGRLVAVLPLYLSSRGPLRVVRFIGHGAADQLGPVCAPRDRIAAAGALRRFLRESPLRWDVFAGEQLPGDEGWGALLGARTIGFEGNPVVRFSVSDWDAFLASLSSRLRQEIRYDARRLDREHDVRFRVADDAKTLSRELDTLFDLHVAQRGGSESAFVGAREAFHREFAATALERGWLRLWMLEVDGKPAAAKYNFRFGDVEFSYQAGRDPSWRRFSIGLVILAHAIRESLEAGMREYRFLRGGEPYKYRLATADPGLETVALGRGPLTEAALGMSLVVGDRLSLPALRHRLAQ